MSEIKILKPEIDWWDRSKLIPLRVQQVENIAIHHMAHPTWGFWDVHGFHKNIRKWNGIGYNYFVTSSGDIIQGRGNFVGAGVAGINSKTINIGFQGDFHGVSRITDIQFNAGVRLIKHIMKQYPNIRKIDGHKGYSATNCPGQHFPLKEMLTLKERNVNEVDPIKEAVDILVKHGIINSPNYWIENARVDKTPNGEFVGFLILNMAKKLEGGK